MFIGRFHIRKIIRNRSDWYVVGRNMSSTTPLYYRRYGSRSKIRPPRYASCPFSLCSQLREERNGKEEGPSRTDEWRGESDCRLTSPEPKRIGSTFLLTF